MKKTKLFISVFITITVIFTVAISDTKENLIGKTIISTVDNLRIRETSDLNSKVIGFINKGDIAVISEISSIKTKVKDKEDNWYKIKTDTTVGWVFGGLITSEFHMSSDKNIVLWYNDIIGPNEDDIKTIVSIYNKKQKKLFQSSDIPWGLYDIKISPDGKYFAVASVVDGNFTIHFYKSDTMKKLEVKSYYDKEVLKWKIKWTGNNRLDFNESIYSTPEGCNVCVKSIFEDGKLSSGKDNFLFCKDQDQCCDELYRVNVVSLKIYEKAGGNAKVIGTLAFNDYVSKYAFEKETLTSGNSDWIQIMTNNNCYADKKQGSLGYVLKKELTKVK